MGAALQQAGEGLAFDGDRTAGRDGVDDRAVEDVGARVDLVGDDLLGRLRLLQEGGHPAGLVGRHQAEGARVGDLGQVQRDVGAGGAVGVHQGRDVQSGEDVAVEDQDRVAGCRVQAGGDVADGAAGAQRLLLGDVLQVQSERRPVTEIRLEHFGEVGRGQHDVLHTRGAGARQLVGEEGDTGGRDHRLGRVHRQRAQPGALAADQEDRFSHLVFSASCWGRPVGGPV